MHGRYLPPSTEPGGENLRRSFTRGVEFIRTELDYVFEQAIAYFLFAALQQFYFDGNKRTARYQMNGYLMSHGFDAISVLPLLNCGNSMRSSSAGYQPEGWAQPASDAIAQGAPNGTLIL
jgi:Fic family protein